MSNHVWRFARVGGFDQVEISTGADLVALDQLDLKLWAALTMPVQGLHFDAQTLKLLDGDGDGRIHAREFAAATRWAGSMLKDVEVLAKGSESLPLSAIAETADAKVLADAARLLLSSLGKAEATSISVGEIVEAVKAFVARDLNGDGVVPADAGGDDEAKKALADVLACTTPATDKSGKPGVTADTLKAFFEDVAAHVEWADKAGKDAAVIPLGADTTAAYTALEAVRAKVDDYFARARVAAFDARAVALINGEDKEYVAALAQTLSSGAGAMERFPVALLTEGARCRWPPASTRRGPRGSPTSARRSCSRCWAIGPR
jgi:hypothetical protein